MVTGDRLSTQGILREVWRYAEAIAPHDLRRTFAKLAFKGGAKLDQIQLSLGPRLDSNHRTVSRCAARSDGCALRLPASQGGVMPIRANNRKYDDARWRKFRLTSSRPPATFAIKPHRLLTFCTSSILTVLTTPGKSVYALIKYIVKEGPHAQSGCR